MKKIGFISGSRIKGSLSNIGSVTKTGNYVITDIDGVSNVVADGSSNSVQITLPAALGTGRMIFVVASDVSNAVTIIRAGSDVIGASGTSGEIYQAWGFTLLVDVATGQWAEILSWQAGW